MLVLINMNIKQNGYIFHIIQPKYIGQQHSNSNKEISSGPLSTTLSGLTYYEWKLWSIADALLKFANMYMVHVSELFTYDMQMNTSNKFVQCYLTQFTNWRYYDH